MSAERARGSLFAVLTAILLCLLPSVRARAAMMTHHDLTSLALESEVVVLARVVGIREGEWSPLRNHEILEVYAGAGLAPGDQLELDCGTLQMRSSWTDPDEAVVPDDEVVLFLAHDYRGTWRLLGSGLRIFADGVTYRFEQDGNPGPYTPVVQGHDPYDLLDDPRGGPGLERAEFEVELRAAIERADAVRQALATVDSAEGRARLLAFLGPEWGLDDDEPCRFHGFSFYEDLTRTRILRALADTGDLEATLEGVSRVCGELFYPDLGIGSRRLLKIAGDAARPVHHRLAALRLLREDAWALHEPGLVDAVIPLLGDPDPRIRAAAAIPVDEEHASEGWRAAIVDRLRVETDDRVRFELRVVAEHNRLPDLPDLRDPIVTVVRSGRYFEVRWVGAGLWQLERLSIALHPRQGPTRTLKLDPQELGWWSSGIRQGVMGWLLVDEPLPNKPVEIEVVAVLTQDERVHEARVSMRAIGLVPEPAITEPEAAPEPTPIPSGCACRAEQPPAPGGILVLALALLGLRASGSARRCRSR